MDSAARDHAASEHPKADAALTVASQGNESDVHPAYDAASVDRSLIRWMLSLTPSERLKHAQGTIDLVRDVPARAEWRSLESSRSSSPTTWSSTLQQNSRPPLD